MQKCNMMSYGEIEPTVRRISLTHNLHRRSRAWCFHLGRSLLWQLVRFASHQFPPSCMWFLHFFLSDHFMSFHIWQDNFIFFASSCSCRWEMSTDVLALEVLEVQDQDHHARVVTASVSGRHATVDHGPAMMIMGIATLASFSLVAAQPRQVPPKRHHMNAWWRGKTVENVISRAKSRVISSK